MRVFSPQSIVCKTRGSFRALYQKVLVVAYFSLFEQGSVGLGLPDKAKQTIESRGDDDIRTHIYICVHVFTHTTHRIGQQNQACIMLVSSTVP
jgi:hypothetical protein